MSERLVRSYSHEDAPEVEVFWQGRWCFGTLHEWRRDDESQRFRGWVRFNVGVGENRIEVFNQAHIRQA